TTIDTAGAAALAARGIAVMVLLALKDCAWAFRDATLRAHHDARASPWKISNIVTNPAVIRKMTLDSEIAAIGWD
ncbi:MAG TPA: hypothetical protein VEF03_03295, partial [Candidatus Binataceae bacterium]|nr:hypothetical protein [Candidatus Binataceae bacterium]